MPILIFLLALVLLPIFYVVSVYNGLVSKRNMVENALGTIDVMLKKRHDLIPNLVETVKGFAAHERETFEKVIALRNQATSAGLPMKDRLELEDQIVPQLGRLLAVAESYPELKSSDQFLNLQRNLTETEEQLSAARRSYNGAVYGINNAVESFPSNLIAQNFGFQKHEFFEASKIEREPVKVDFGS